MNNTRVTNKDIEGKKCPFRTVEIQKGIIHKTRDVEFKDCLENQCPYYLQWGIFCNKARDNR